MTEPAASTPEPELGLLGRAIGVVTSPAATFAHVVRAPRPAAILLIVSAVIAVAATVPQMTERGRLATLTAQVEMMERFMGEIPDDMYAQLETQSRNPLNAVWGVVGAFVWMPIMALFFTALLWGIFNALMGGTGTFKQVLGVVTHSMVIMALGAAAAIPIQLMQSSFSFTGPFNLGALVPMMDPDSFIVRFLSWTSAITVWQTIVIAIGLGVLYKRRSTGIAIGLLAAYGGLVLVGVSIYSAFVGRMGS